MERNGVVIGVDVGGTKTHAAAFDQCFNVITDLKAPTLIGGVDQVGAGIISTIATLRTTAQGGRDRNPRNRGQFSRVGSARLQPRDRR